MSNASPTSVSPQEPLKSGVTSISQACVNFGEGFHLAKAACEKEVWTSVPRNLAVNGGLSVGETCHAAR